MRYGFRSLREILKTNFIEQGRKVKEAAGGMFYDPARWSLSSGLIPNAPDVD